MVKTIIISEDKSIEIKPLKTKEGGKLIKRIGDLIKRTQEDNTLRASFNGLVALAEQDKMNAGFLVTAMPLLMCEFYDEFVGILSDLTGLTIDEIEDMEIDKPLEITLAIVEVNDFDKVKAMLKNFKGLLPQTKGKAKK